MGINSCEVGAVIAATWREVNSASAVVGNGLQESEGLRRVVSAVRQPTVSLRVEYLPAIVDNGGGEGAGEVAVAVDRERGSGRRCADADIARLREEEGTGRAERGAADVVKGELALGAGADCPAAEAERGRGDQRVRAVRLAEEQLAVGWGGGEAGAAVADTDRAGCGDDAAVGLQRPVEGAKGQSAIEDR